MMGIVKVSHIDLCMMEINLRKSRTKPQHELYYAPLDSGGFTAVDNTTNDMWTEWFISEKAAIDWLNRVGD